MAWLYVRLAPITHPQGHFLWIFETPCSSYLSQEYEQAKSGYKLTCIYAWNWLTVGYACKAIVILRFGKPQLLKWSKRCQNAPSYPNTDSYIMESIKTTNSNVVEADRKIEIKKKFKSFFMVQTTNWDASLTICNKKVG